MEAPNEDVRLFRRRLRYAMDKRRMHTQDVANASGLSVNTVREYVRGRHMPNARALIALCASLEVSADYLLGLV